MPTNTLLTLGCGDCHTCGNPPPDCPCDWTVGTDVTKLDFIRLYRPPGCGNTVTLYPAPGIPWAAEICGVSGAVPPDLPNPVVFIDDAGNGWILGWSTAGLEYTENRQRLFLLYTYERLIDGLTAQQIFYYETGNSCDTCWESISFNVNDFDYIRYQLPRGGVDSWPNSKPTTLPFVCAAATLTATQLVNCSDCAANCCTDLGTSGITSVNFDLVASGLPAIFPFSSCDAAYSATVNVANTGSCEWTWSLPAPGSPPPDCFTDSAAEDWYFNEKRIEITSTNTAGTPPCTMLKFVMEYVRSSDSAVASQYWNFDFNYCDVADIPLGTPLSLSSTTHDFPNGAPGFRSVSITPN